MKKDSKRKKYQRLNKQLQGILGTTDNVKSRLATIEAILHHKMQYYFWTGVYMLRDGDLLVESYQGPVACQKLKKDVGVCWAAINQNKTLVIPNVEEFPGHIACNSATNSEIVVPLRNKEGEVIGCFDVDSRELESFDEVDAEELEKILDLVYSVPVNK
ncbi:GAF domain-containing protein [Marinifilum sp. RC60d5]|uniref:GAF domain-containing protein n=1 Tax=Marinifilum sp. RC60d5 TaxID=3458414 RepID=UPI00403642C1